MITVVAILGFFNSFSTFYKSNLRRRIVIVYFSVFQKRVFFFFMEGLQV